MSDPEKRFGFSSDAPAGTDEWFNDAVAQLADVVDQFEGSRCPVCGWTSFNPKGEEPGECKTCAWGPTTLT